MVNSAAYSNPDSATNMTHMDIDIIVYEEGHHPEIKSFKQDPNFPWKEDDMLKLNPLAETKQGKMTVLNYKDIHFNLIVGPNHMLSQVGSIYFQASCEQAEQRTGGEEDRSARNNPRETIMEGKQPSPDPNLQGSPQKPGDCGECGGKTVGSQEPHTEYIEELKLIITKKTLN